MSHKLVVVGLLLGAFNAPLLAADPDPLAERLKTYLGLSEEEVVQRTGPPDFVYEASEVNSKYIAYERSASGSIPGIGPAYTVHAAGDISSAMPTGGPPGLAYSRSCQWGFELHNDHVVTYRYEGSGCLARQGELTFRGE
jgi:hypothetical protein